MRLAFSRPIFPFLASSALLLVLAAGSVSPAAAGWGPRVGVSDGPDQVLAGFHWTGARLAPRLSLRPSATLGVGSDRKIFTASLPLYYRFPVRSRVTPFAGGGVAAGVIDHDFRDDTNVEIALEALGGLEWRLQGGARFALELNLGFGDLHDIRLFAGWILN